MICRPIISKKYKSSFLSSPSTPTSGEILSNYSARSWKLIMPLCKTVVTGNGWVLSFSFVDDFEWGWVDIVFWLVTCLSIRRTVQYFLSYVYTRDEILILFYQMIKEPIEGSNEKVLRIQQKYQMMTSIRKTSKDKIMSWNSNFIHNDF